MATFNVKSRNQSGGMTVGQINSPELRPPRRRWRVWQLVVAIGVIVSILAGVAQILGYLHIGLLGGQTP